jgi:flavorubredoxin
MNITKDIKYIGVNDHKIDLFEGQYIVPNGMAYNSYAIIDEKIAIMDSVDAAFTQEWLANIQNVLGERRPDYLVVQHMEPDHSANIANFLSAYPEAVVVASAKAKMTKMQKIKARNLSKKVAIFVILRRISLFCIKNTSTKCANSRIEK